MVFSEYQKQRMLHYYFLGYRAPTIAAMLKKERVKAGRKGVHQFIRRYRQTGSIARRPGSGPKPKITSEIMQVVEQQMRLDDKTTVMQLHRLIEEKGYSMSLRTVLRCHTALGWTFRGSAYCQLIHQAKKEKRLQWARSCLDSEDEFENVVWSDECTLQTESHRRDTCHKRGEKPRNKPR